jgi:hypothetical protein
MRRHNLYLIITIIIIICVPRRIFEPKRDEVIGSWRTLHDEKLHNLYSLSNIIRVIKSRRMRWAGHVESMRRRGMHIGF